MRNMNNVQICGRLGRDAETRHTVNGMRITNLAVATSVKMKDGVGEKTQWHKVTAFENDNLASAKKGDAVMIFGSIEYSKYKDKNGQERESTSIVASTGAVLSRRVSIAINEDPFAQATPASAEGSGFATDLDDDLPF